MFSRHRLETNRRAPLSSPIQNSGKFRPSSHECQVLGYGGKHDPRAPPLRINCKPYSCPTHGFRFYRFPFWVVFLFPLPPAVRVLKMITVQFFSQSSARVPTRPKFIERAVSRHVTIEKVIDLRDKTDMEAQVIIDFRAGLQATNCCKVFHVVRHCILAELHTQNKRFRSRSHSSRDTRFGIHTLHETVACAIIGGLATRPISASRIQVAEGISSQF